MAKKLLILLIVLSYNTYIQGQIENYNIDSLETYSAVDVMKSEILMPCFPGCDSNVNSGCYHLCSITKFKSFLEKNLTWPEQALNNCMAGTVIVKVIVGYDGYIYDSELVRDVGAGTGNEALRLVNLMNDQIGPWVIPKLNSKNYNYKIYIPIRFHLE